VTTNSAGRQPSSSRLGRDGHILIPAGLNLTNYRKNPIILWQHNPGAPVARCVSISVVDGELRGAGEFPPAGTSDTADEVCGLVKSGVVSAVSIGFDVVDAQPLDPKRPYGGQRIVSSELLECSLVSVPADTGAVITERALRSGTMMSAEASRHLIRASEAVDEADRHHEALGRHLDNGNERAAGAAHKRLGRCIGDAQRCFRALADQAVLDDIHASQSLQTSSGVTTGTSSFTAPLSRAERQLEALRLQLPAGGAVDAAATRDREFLRRLVHCEQVGRAMATDGDFAERQRALRRLVRAG
jgi:HK97 family phage prohead protease